MIIIEDRDVIFTATSLLKALLAKKRDVSDCKIKVSKTFAQSEKLR